MVSKDSGSFGASTGWQWWRWQRRRQQRCAGPGCARTTICAPIVASATWACQFAVKSASGAPSAGQASALDRQRRATGFQRVPTYPVVAPMAPIAWQHAASSSGTAARRAHTRIAGAPAMPDPLNAQVSAASMQQGRWRSCRALQLGRRQRGAAATAAPLAQRLMPTPITHTGVLFCYCQQGHSRTTITHNITWLLDWAWTRQRWHATLKRWRRTGAHALPLQLISV